jgi:type IV secretory pathway TrbD component
MPALRAITLLGFLAGTAVGAIGIIRNLPELAIAGAVMWIVGVGLGLFLHRLDPKFSIRDHVRQAK